MQGRKFENTWTIYLLLRRIIDKRGGTADRGIRKVEYQMKRKFMSLILALKMIRSLFVPALAVEGTSMYIIIKVVPQRYCQPR